MVWYILGDCARKKITRSSAFIGRAERAAANPDEGEILPVLPMNVYSTSARLIRCWGIAMFCGVVVSFRTPQGFDSVHPIIKDIAKR